MLRSVFTQKTNVAVLSALVAASVAACGTTTTVLSGGSPNAATSTATGPSMPGTATATIGDVTVTCKPHKYPAQGFLAVAEQQGSDTAVTFLPTEGSSFGARLAGLPKAPTTAEELATGKIVAVWTLPHPDLPSPYASVVPAAWEALAEGKQPNKSDVSYNVNDPEFHDRMFDYAKYTLADPAENPSTRCNALSALARIGAKAEEKEVNGKSVVSVTPKNGMPAGRGENDIITVDITTGWDTSMQPFTTFTVDTIPTVVTDTFNKVKDNKKICSTRRNSTYCSIPPH